MDDADFCDVTSSFVTINKSVKLSLNGDLRTHPRFRLPAAAGVGSSQQN
jgi:hypothetical protein